MAGIRKQTRSKGPADLGWDFDLNDRKRRNEFRKDSKIETEDAATKKQKTEEEEVEEDFHPKEELETDDVWMGVFTRLKRLCTPNQKFPKLDFKKDSELIRWLNIQHLHQKDLSKTQRRLLNELGYDWQRIMFKGTWDDNVEKLVSLKRKDGTFGISGLRVKDPRFYSWAVNARYRARWGGMTGKKINQLRDIGFLEERDESSSNDEKPTLKDNSVQRVKKMKKEFRDEDSEEEERFSAEEDHSDLSSDSEREPDFEEEDRFDISSESDAEEEAVALMMVEMVNSRANPLADSISSFVSPVC